MKTILAVFEFLALVVIAGAAAADTVKFTKSSKRDGEGIAAVYTYDANKRIPQWEFFGGHGRVDAADVLEISGGPWQNVEVVLRDGARSTSNTVLEIKKSKIRMRMSSGKEVSVPLGRIAYMQFHNAQKTLESLEKDADEAANGPIIAVTRLEKGSEGRITAGYKVEKTSDNLIFARLVPVTEMERAAGRPYLFVRTPEPAGVVSGQYLRFRGKWKVVGTHSLSNDETHFLVEPADEAASVSGY